MKDPEITTIRPGDKNYPKLLAEIADPPETLYCRGNTDLLKSFCLGVVGTRKLTSYGREATEKIVRGLVQNNFTIVSGLAMGIDTIAHQTTLDCGGGTIAVLGTGINNIYPSTNLELGKNILKNNGLIISEYPTGTPGLKHRFPERNRIISGLSKGVVVIEADEKSGALITAGCAIDQNRDVFAVPGSIFSFKSLGPNGLIKKGAKLVSSVHDILDEYQANPELFERKNSSLSTKDPTEKNILAILDGHGSMFIDEIIRLSENEASEIMAKLSLMELRGAVKNLGNGKYRKL